MTIQRQYSLPNCQLTLQGLSDDVAEPLNGAGAMSILVTAECHFLSSNQVITGGRGFLENLVTAVNAYAQEYLSGLRHPQEVKKDADVVHLELDASANLHRLEWQPVPESEKEEIPEKVEVKLTTLELFELVEVLDQFLADSLTLPEMTLHLQPVSNKYRQADEPILQRITPPVLGVASLALAGLALLFVPAPPVKQLETPAQEVNNTTETLPETPEESSSGSSPE